LKLLNFFNQTNKKTLEFTETRLMSHYDVSATNDAICAGEQERRKVKKKKKEKKGKI